MSCRRICQELLWATRYGEIGPDSQPHLDHLAGCSACRDEVGFDRALVQQLRNALAERVAEAEPPATAWAAILERARTPEPRRGVVLWQWSTGVVGRLRIATAMAGTGLALILAINMDVVTVPLPAGQPASAAVREAPPLEQVPRMTTGRTGLVAYARLANEISASSPRGEEESTLTRAVPRLQPRASEAGTAEEAAEQEGSAMGVQLRLTVRPMQTPEPAGSAGEASADGGTTWQAVRSAPGEPS